MGDVTVAAAQMSGEFDAVRALTKKRLPPVVAETVRKDLTRFFRYVKEEIEHGNFDAIVEGAMRRYVDQQERLKAELGENGELVFKMRMPELPASRARTRARQRGRAEQRHQPTQGVQHDAILVTLRYQLLCVTKCRSLAWLTCY